MNLDQIQTTEDDEQRKNPNLTIHRHSYGCWFGEEDDQGNVLYDGEIQHAPDTNELIIGEAWVYDND